jgi:hypothetical protein
MLLTNFWFYFFRMDLREIGLGGVDWIRLSQDRDRVAGCCECGDEPSGSCATELVSCIKMCSSYCAILI